MGDNDTRMGIVGYEYEGKLCMSRGGQNGGGQGKLY